MPTKSTARNPARTKLNSTLGLDASQVEDQEQPEDETNPPLGWDANEEDASHVEDQEQPEDETNPPLGWDADDEDASPAVG
jgi:hypothetical protein